MKIDALTGTLLYGICKGPKIAVIHVCFDTQISMDAYDLLTSFKPIQHAIKKTHTRPTKLIQFTNGSIMDFRALDKDDIRGMRSSLMLVEQPNVFNKQAWSEVLLPVLSAYSGKVFIIQ